MNTYKITLWYSNTAYCRKWPDKESCTYTVEVDAPSDYLARERAIRYNGLPSDSREIPIVYEVEMV